MNTKKTFLGLVIIASLFGIAQISFSENNPPSSSPEFAKCGDQGTDVSKLWGYEGENYTPGKRLSDWSFAGYKSGEVAIPNAPIVTNVVLHGATPDDDSDDDTAAFRNAIDFAANTPNGGAVYIPPGKFSFDQIIYLTKSNVVLRGSGRKTTTLHFRKSVSEMRDPNTYPPKVPSTYSHGRGGGIWVDGSGQSLSPPSTVRGAGPFLTRVLTPPNNRKAGKQGRKWLYVEDPSGIQIGETYVLRMTDDANRNLAKHAHNNQSNPGTCKGGDGDFQWAFRVKMIVGNYIVFKQPLPLNVHQSDTPSSNPNEKHKWDWQPHILQHNHIEHVGVEDLAITYPAQSYPGHHNEWGHNGIFFVAAVDFWARRIDTQYVDNGIYVTGVAKFGTIEDIHLIPRVSGFNPPPVGMHHGITMDAAHSILVQNINHEENAVHEFSYQMYANGNVLRNSNASDGQLDFHGRAPFRNALINIDVGLASPYSVWISGGCSGVVHAGAGNTFWNIHGARISYNSPLSSPLWDHITTNIIGFTPDTVTLGNKGKWHERLGNIRPTDLYCSQVVKRTGRAPQ